MKPCRTPGLLVALILLGILTAGCNPLAAPFFLFGPEPKRPALYQPLIPDDAKDKDRTLKVAVLTYAALETRTDPQFLQADREVGALVCNHLQEACTYNKEKVKVLDPRKVEEFKNSHHDWKQMDPAEIGAALKVDAVVVLEIRALSLHDKTNETMYRGRAEVGVSLVRVGDDEEGLSLPPRNFVCTYPGEGRGGFVSADFDKPVEVFKAEFFNVLGRKLAWHFTAHPTSQDYLCE